MDIVERLRDPNWIKYCPEAADEIERLREALQGLFTVVENAFPNLLNTEPMKKARDALKGDE
jgi:hypothetical protein